MNYYCPEKRSTITLSPSQKLGGGGEGNIYAVGQIPGCVAKILHQPTTEQQRKLEAMLANPCNGHANGCLSVAWPQGLLFTTSGRQRFSGYLMAKVSGASAVLDFYHPKTRRQKCPRFNYRYLHRAALNLTNCISLAHRSGYVIGDVNESNFLVADNACVTMVDADSWQIRDKATSRIFRCPVGKPDFIPPELQGKNLGKVTRTVLHDRFGHGVLLFKLLMEGTHPFDGVFSGTGDAASIEARIAAGHFPYGKRSVPWSPKPFAPTFEILDPRLQQLFVRCFADGHFSAYSRPDAKEWHGAIAEAEKALIVCPHNDQHWFGKHLSFCPWCERVALLKVDPFPASSLPHVTTRRSVSRPRVLRAPRTTAVTPQNSGYSPAMVIGGAFVILLILISFFRLVAIAAR